MLNLGCGTSRLGQALADTLSARRAIGAVEVMNVDYSVAAIRAAGSLGAHDERQHFHVWDVTAGRPPPQLSGSPPTSWPVYDLLVDKGTLDVLIFTGPEHVVAYCSALRACLLPSVGERIPLFVHFSDDESRGELLEAAFPARPCGGGAVPGWRVESTQLESEADAGWDTYRFLVHASPHFDVLK